MSIYLDNAATTFPKPEEVYRATEHALRFIGVAPGRGGYRQGLDASRMVFEARESIARLFGVSDSSRIVFTHSATEALNLAVTGLLRPGDHVVTTTMEHNSLARPLFLAAQRGVEVTWVDADAAGFVSPASIAGAMRSDTRLVALAHCSNVTGTIQPIGEIGALTRKTGAVLLVDAAQSAGAIPIDVRNMGIGLLAVPGHKGLFGPQGTGFLYVDQGVELSPLLVGGTGTSSSSLEQPESMPERFESGTLNTSGIAGLKAGVEFVARQGVAAIGRAEGKLVDAILRGLDAMPGVALYGPRRDEERGAVVSFTVDGHDPAQVGFLLDREYDISVRVGLHCAVSAHKTIGTYPGGTVRVSPGLFTTAGEVETFLSAMQRISTR
jgi:cysteine desulfurase / selenocysteine lyase